LGNVSYCTQRKAEYQTNPPILTKFRFVLHLSQPGERGWSVNHAIIPSHVPFLCVWPTPAEYQRRNDRAAAAARSVLCVPGAQPPAADQREEAQAAFGLIAAPARAQERLRRTLYLLRQAIEPHTNLIETEGDGTGCRAGRQPVVDYEAFEKALMDAYRHDPPRRKPLEDAARCTKMTC
jgi:hypothetical protein